MFPGFYPTARHMIEREHGRRPLSIMDQPFEYCGMLSQ
jgi:hypothetical protein